MTKRILYLEDLYDFYSNKYKRSTKFSAEKSGEPLVVQVHGRVNFDESDRNKDGLLPVHLQSCHTDLNVNGSNIDSSVMEAALPSFSNRPILGYIHKVTTDETPEGQWEFYSHNMHEDENGEVIYDEFPIGIIPESCNAQLVYDKEKKKTYCEVDGYIFEEYSKAAEILQREGECSVSVELSIRELSYDARQKFLNIKDFWFSGVTILGKTPQGDEVKPGMSGSNIKLADFSSKNNSLFSDYESKMVELQARLEKLETACFDNKNNSKEGGNNVNMNKFEELCQKYGKTVDDITFDYENMSDEELVEAFAKAFDDTDTTDGTTDNTSTEDTPSTDEGVEPTNDEPTESTKDDSKEDSTTDESTTTPSDDDEVKKKVDNSVSNNTVEYSFVKDGEIKKFAVSLQDKIYAIQDLVNATYAEADNTYYGVTVYDDYVIMCDWWSGRYYKQTYDSKEDNYSLTGDRVEVYVEFVTADEQKELDDMRSNYAELKAFKKTVEKNELHEKREKILADERYESISTKDKEGNFVNKDFAELYKNMDNYSLAELETQVKVIHSDFIAEHSTFSASTEEKKSTSKKQFANPSKVVKSSRYGKLFQNK